MKHRRILSLVLGMGALALPAASGASAPAAGVIVDANAFVAGSTIAGGYEYTIVAWKDDVAGGGRLVVSRIRWDSTQREVEDAILSDEALTLTTTEAGGYAIDLDATLAGMGRFKLSLSADAASPRTWMSRYSFVAARRAAETWVNALSSHQIAGSADTGHLYMIWGSDVTGLALE